MQILVSMAEQASVHTPESEQALLWIFRASRNQSQHCDQASSSSSVKCNSLPMQVSYGDYKRSSPSLCILMATTLTVQVP